MSYDGNWADFCGFQSAPIPMVTVCVEAVSQDYREKKQAKLDRKIARAQRQLIDVSLALANRREGGQRRPVLRPR